MKNEIKPIKNIIVTLGQEKKKNNFFKSVRLHKTLLIMLIPAIVYYIIFHYIPIYGIVIAFKNFSFSKGIWNSDWIGLVHFKRMFGSEFFLRAFKNTVIISLYRLLFEFPIPIIFAIILNELKNIYYKKIVQTISYLPFFLSWVVVAGVLYSFLNTQTGIINLIIKAMGKEPYLFMQSEKAFRSIIILSNIWKNMGWSSIIYIATISTLDLSLYEAAKIDGAKRWQQIIYITLPGLVPTITILLILKIGNILNAGFDQIFVLYNPLVYNVADIIDTYVYRVGLIENQWGFGTAVGLLKSILSLILLFNADRFAKRMGQTGIW